MFDELTRDLINTTASMAPSGERGETGGPQQSVTAPGPSVRRHLRVQGSRFNCNLESGPLRAVHVSRHKWPGGLVN